MSDISEEIMVDGAGPIAGTVYPTEPSNYPKMVNYKGPSIYPKTGDYTSINLEIPTEASQIAGTIYPTEPNNYPKMENYSGPRHYPTEEIWALKDGDKIFFDDDPEHGLVYDAENQTLEIPTEANVRDARLQYEDLLANPEYKMERVHTIDPETGEDIYKYVQTNEYTDEYKSKLGAARVEYENAEAVLSEMSTITNTSTNNGPNNSANEVDAYAKFKNVDEARLQYEDLLANPEYKMEKILTIDPETGEEIYKYVQTNEYTDEYKSKLGAARVEYENAEAALSEMSTITNTSTNDGPITLSVDDLLDSYYDENIKNGYDTKGFELLESMRTNINLFDSLEGSKLLELQGSAAEANVAVFKYALESQRNVYEYIVKSMTPAMSAVAKLTLCLEGRKEIKERLETLYEELDELKTTLSRTDQYKIEYRTIIDDSGEEIKKEINRVNPAYESLQNLISNKEKEIEELEEQKEKLNEEGIKLLQEIDEYDQQNIEFTSFIDSMSAFQ